MNDKNIPFQTIDWTNVPKTEHAGEKGIAYWQTLKFAGLRIRIVEYSAGYAADHWCEKGHIVHCLEGEFVNEQKDGTNSVLTKGMSYVVSDDLSSHRSTTQNGARLMIIDGDFLKYHQDVRKSRLSNISKILNGYLVISVLIFIPIFFNDSDVLCGNEMVAPFELFFNLCFPVGFIAFIWGAKLALNLKEWLKLAFNSAKFAFPLAAAIAYYQILQMMNLEVTLSSIWWLGFL